jgi:citrate synthase
MLSADEAARRLAVKPETLYAYVSRGMLTRHRAPDGRRSLFERAEIERLAARSRRGGRAGSLELIVDTQLTLVDPAGALYYRGHDATRLAREKTYEEVAELLWGGDDAAGGAGAAWIASGGGAAAAAGPVIAPGARLADRLRVIVALAAAADPLRNDLRPPAVRHVARGLIAGMVDGLPRLSEPAGATIAARLWSRLRDAPPSPAELRVLNAALVLLADHELAVSALAARVAASAWSDPYLVVLAGLAALGGPLHGGAPGAVERLLAPLDARAGVAAALGERLSAGEPLPGFGHKVYRGTDPRAEALLALLREAQPPRLDIVDEVLALAGRHDGPKPNVDLALGAMSDAFGFVPGAAEAIFAIARSAGFIAHALEEYPYRLRFRPRAAYVGPAPPGGDTGRSD